MSKREKEDKGGEEGGMKKHKSAEDLGRKLLRAAEEGDVESVKELLQCEGVDVRYYDLGDGFGGPKTVLVVACERGLMVVARILLEHGGETQQELEEAFCVAADGGHVELVKILMERGVRLYSIDPSARENLAVQGAARNGRINVVKLLLQDERVNPAARDNFAVNYAACIGYCDVLEVLLADARVDGTDAISTAHPRVVHVLLEDERC
jgi:hypothetical protein